MSIQPPYFRVYDIILYMKYRFTKKRAIKLVLFILMLAMVWGFIWSWAITKTVKKNSSDAKMKNQHAIVKNIVVTETQEEKKYWEFYAKSGEYVSQDNNVKLYDIIGNFYDKNEQVVVSFKSSKGSYDEKTKKVILSGDILFVSKNDSQLYADEIIWQGQDKDILANGNVQYIQEGKIVTKSKHAIFNSSLTYFKIMGNAKTQLFADNKEKKKYTQL